MGFPWVNSKMSSSCQRLLTESTSKRSVKSPRAFPGFALSTGRQGRFCDTVAAPLVCDPTG
jgi:hypothetical protein